MANTTVDTPVRRRLAARHDRLEYRVYVALIFVLALPFALAAWAWDAVFSNAAPEAGAPGPWTRALTESRLLAAMVFRA